MVKEGMYGVDGVFKEKMKSPMMYSKVATRTSMRIWK